MTAKRDVLPNRRIENSGAARAACALAKKDIGVYSGRSFVRVIMES